MNFVNGCQTYPNGYNCPYLRYGFNGDSCPLAKTGIYITSLKLPDKIATEIFSSQNKIIFKGRKPVNALQIVKNSLSESTLTDFWTMLGRFYDTHELFSANFDFFASVFNPNISREDKETKLLRVIYVNNKFSPNEYYTKKDIAYKLVSKEIEKQIKLAIHTTDFYINSVEKDFIDFMIEVIADKTSDALKNLTNR